ncbi:extensin [Malania oleifera]|uniref:extensin n=1 Tax=Malania oleifera TaxID=397392 RepID=UPI0025AE1D24|nr:extensin [Malania oleifera]
MNTSQFMDKQIMDLSSASQKNDFIDLMNPQEEHIGGGKKDEILPNYDFQPIRPLGSSLPSNLDANSAGGSRAWNSTDSMNHTTHIRNYGSLDSIETAKIVLEKDRNVNDTSIVSEIDRAMKKHADNLLHVLEGVSARLSQLETRSRHLENSVDDLKVSVGNNHGNTDGRMRQLENILREVQTGVEVLRDKQEIVEAQLQLSKLQVSKAEQQSETPNTVHMDPVQQPASAPQQQSHQHISTPVLLSQSHPALAPPNTALPPLSQQNHPPAIPLPNQFPQSQIVSIPQREPYYPPPAQTQETPNQQYAPPPAQQPQPPPPALPHQQYQPAPHPPYSQPPQQHPSLAPVNPSQVQPSLVHHPEETPYIPSPPNYPPSLRQPPSHPSSGAPPSQQFYGAPPSHMYEPPSSRASSGFSTAYGGPPSIPSEPYSFSGSPSQYGSTAMKPPQISSPSVAQSGGSGYPQLPTARVLPQALPTASGVGGGSGPAGTGNRVPIDDVVDKVTSMGFPREHVRATVRKLTDNGQSVDLNVVLDKLMNDGEVQPPKGWFGR